MAPTLLLRASSLAALLALAAIPGGARADDIGADARAHFKAGVAYLEDPEGQRFEDAYAEFSKAYELSHSPRILGNLALCAMKLERDGEAIDGYSRYLTEVVDIDPAERAQIVRDLQTLRESIATATVTVDAPSATLVDTRVPVRGPNVTNAYEITGGTATLRIRPGHHVVHLRASGREVADWEFTAEASVHSTHSFEASPPPAAPLLVTSTAAVPHRDRTGPILLTGLGAVGLVVGGVLGASTLQKVHILEGECPGNVCSASVYSHDLSTAHTFVAATDYSLLGGGLVAASGVLWLLLSRPAGEPSPSTTIGSACTKAGCYATVHLRY